MSSKQVHYNIDKLNSYNALINWILGEKSNGKSYQVKHKEAVEHYLETGNRFIILRRWKEDISALWIEQYFADVDIAKLTNNRYNCISQYRRVLYLSNYDVDTGKTKRYEKIGYVMALSTEQHMSSASFLDVDRIIFEEFLERGNYLKNEPDLLSIYYSTIDRKRGTTKLYLVGNTISKVCPYINAWGLDEIFKSIKQGEIKTKEIKIDEENSVTIAVEYCQKSGGKKLAIGNASSMIDSGAWQTFPQPKLPKSYKEYSVLYRFGFMFKTFKFICEYLVDDVSHETLFYIYPFYKDFNDNIIVFSDIVSQSQFWQRNIYDIDMKNEKLKNLFSNFRESKIFYSSDLCGTDFKQVIDFSIRR